MIARGIRIAISHAESSQLRTIGIIAAGQYQGGRHRARVHTGVVLHILQLDGAACLPYRVHDQIGISSDIGQLHRAAPLLPQGKSGKINTAVQTELSATLQGHGAI